MILWVVPGENLGGNIFSGENDHETWQRSFLLAVLGVDPAQNLTKYERWLCAHTAKYVIHA